MEEHAEQPVSLATEDHHPAEPAPLVEQGEQPAPLATEDQPEETTAPREPSQFAVAMQIANRLGETAQKTRQQVVQTVRLLGRTQALALLEETMEIEANGGMMLSDGSGRRAPGGVFFFLVKSKGRPKDHPWLQPGKEAGGASPRNHPPKPRPAPLPALAFDERITVIKAIGETRGTANVKMVVSGRPGKIIEKGTCVVTVMRSTNVPSLPKGLPVPPNASTDYVVYIATKQWRRVEETLRDPEDILIVEGFPQLDAGTQSIAVFATNTTTKKLQSAQRQAQATSEPV